MVPLQYLRNISTLGSFFAQDAVGDLLQIGPRKDVKMREDLMIIAGGIQHS